MKTLVISTYLEADPQTLQDHIGRSALLHYVARGVLRFVPVDPPAFPEQWERGKYTAKMYWKGFFPLGLQTIGIEPQPVKDGVWSMRDNGYGTMIKTWDHTIEVSPKGSGALYVDRITVDAGILTPVVALFAARFYKHRQKRLRRLVENQFDYSR
ncbi:MAG: hypothetical protein AAFX54_02860 [Pseudomonadota bacterium]